MARSTMLVRIDTGFHKLAKAYAVRLSTTIGAILHEALEEYFARNPKTLKQITEAIDNEGDITQ